jgi:hypothetical protein
MEEPASQEKTQDEVLSELAESSNEQLETAVASASSRAFNLGCSLWLLPTVIVILTVFILSRANWAMTSIAFIIVVLAAAIFTLYVAQQAKKKSTERIYRQDVNPEIDRALREIGVERATFDAQARVSLEPGSLLLEFLDQDSSAQIPDQVES